MAASKETPLPSPPFHCARILYVSVFIVMVLRAGTDAFGDIGRGKTGGLLKVLIRADKLNPPVFPPGRYFEHFLKNRFRNVFENIDFSGRFIYHQVHIFLLR